MKWFFLIHAEILINKEKFSRTGKGQPVKSDKSDRKKWRDFHNFDEKIYILLIHDFIEK